MIMGIVLSKSLDINFIHGDIHGGSCNKILIYYYKLDSLIALDLEIRV